MTRSYATAACKPIHTKIATSSELNGEVGLRVLSAASILDQPNLIQYC